MRYISGSWPRITSRADVAATGVYTEIDQSLAAYFPVISMTLTATTRWCSRSRPWLTST